MKYVTPTEDAISFDTIQHSSCITVKGSIFQCHFHAVHTQKEAKQVLRAHHQNKVLSDSDHVIYAYKYIDLDGQTLEGYSVDGEWNVSCILRDSLQQKGLTEAMLVVTCKYGGYKLGKKRFELIKQVANEAYKVNSWRNIFDILFNIMLLPGPTFDFLVCLAPVKLEWKEIQSS